MLGDAYSRLLLRSKLDLRHAWVPGALWWLPIATASVAPGTTPQLLFYSLPLALWSRILTVINEEYYGFEGKHLMSSKTTDLAFCATTDGNDQFGLISEVGFSENYNRLVL